MYICPNVDLDVILFNYQYGFDAAINSFVHFQWSLEVARVVFYMRSDVAVVG